jgi:adenylate kinase family enzyme
VRGQMRKVAIVSSCSGNGKTTLGRQLAAALEVPFVELDALVHGPNWAETPDDGLRALLEPILEQDGWVIDGNYSSKLGSLVLE